jgi:cytoskeletal protein CcmA (bactofilin family)
VADRSGGSDAAESVIGERATVEGRFRSEHPIRIRGGVRGEVESKRRVVVEAAARVEATIIAPEVVIAGEVVGEVLCFRRVELRPTGRVVGAISTDVMLMGEGAYFDGHLEMSTAADQRRGPRGSRPDARP